MSQGGDGGPAAFIWSVADLLRGAYKKSEYGQVILPFTVLRRLDCLLASASGDPGDGGGDDAAASVQPIQNSSGLSLARVLEDSSEARSRLEAYIGGFGPDIQSVFDGFGLLDEVDRLQRVRLLDVVGRQFLELDLGAATVTHDEVSHLFEELVRRFADLSNETRGEHFTPRDLVELVARLLVEGERPRSVPAGAGISVFDPTCGTGGLLAATEHLLRANTDDLGIQLYGQELNQQTWAICRADMALKGHSAANILLGNSLVDDGHALGKFDYIVANPPFGMEWRQVRDFVDDEHKTRGFAGRFGAGIPRINDGSFLFLQHMISKMKPPEEGGSRLAVILNGSPLFTGTAKSGESKIRRWIIENDLLDTVVALPDQLLFSTTIPIFVWLLSNRKPEGRQGTVQLVDARESFARIRRSLGNKQNQIMPDQTEEILRQVQDYDGNGRSRVLPNAEFLDPESGRCAIEPWMFMAEVDRETHRPLEEFVEFCREAVLDSAAPLLRMEDLDSGARDAAALTESADVGDRRVICVGGDIVGDAHTWRVLPNDFGSAATRLTVMRLRDDIRRNALLLSKWLASPDCQRQQTGTIVRRLNRQTMVPVALVTDDVLAAATADLIEARDESLRQIDRLFPDPFEDTSLQDLVPSNLRTEALKARAVQSLLRPLDDVVQRAELQYPYQIAQLARDFRLSTIIGHPLGAGLLLAESIARSLGTIAAAALAAAKAEQLASTLEHFCRGISMGGWLSILQYAQSESALEAYPELDGVRFTRRGVGALLNQCVSIRNRRAHTPGVKTPAQDNEVLEELKPILNEILDRTMWLSQYEFLSVELCKYVHARHEVRAKRINGSHPDWEPVAVPVSEPVEPNHLYLDAPTNSSLLSLHPFALVKFCPECQGDELYVLDRVRNDDTGVAKSLKDCRIDVELRTQQHAPR